jgi:hypothetical protein
MQTAGSNGKIGNLIDWYQGRADCPHGVTYGNNLWISMAGINANGGSNAGGMWPWDGSTTPILT